ncbi:hypothetical protein D3248_11850 [Leucobacter zeae]|nr:hypothetical protein [Leucobacter zeae]
MTMIDVGPVRADAEGRAPTWSEVEPGFWAGNDAGEFLGTIEARGDRYAAFDPLHRHLGEYATLAQAQARAAGMARR